MGRPPHHRLNVSLGLIITGIAVIIAIAIGDAISVAFGMPSRWCKFVQSLQVGVFAIIRCEG
jgi:hypothetical protein